MSGVHSCKVTTIDIAQPAALRREHQLRMQSSLLNLHASENPKFGILFNTNIAYHYICTITST